jgi:hypothetical protein
VCPDFCDNFKMVFDHSAVCLAYPTGGALIGNIFQGIVIIDLTFIEVSCNVHHSAGTVREKMPFFIDRAKYSKSGCLIAIGALAAMDTFKNRGVIFFGYIDLPGHLVFPFSKKSAFRDS